MNILIVDDDKGILFSLTELLSDNHNVITATNSKDGIEIVKNSEVDLAIIDYQLPDFNGIQLLKEIKKISPSTFVIMITAFGNENIAIEAIKNGAYHYISKPFDNIELLNLIKNIDDLLGYKKKIDSKIDFFITESLKEVIEKCKKVANLSVPILLTGETGTGKDVIANYIHRISGRSGKFVAINCGALPENLIENELFGSEKGSFTGSTKDKAGLFEIANNGTIFLDEIGDLPYNLQVKLLRVIQNNEIRRIGSEKVINVDTRIIAATNKNLKEEIKVGRFREDLYYRLNLINIYLPPLRGREDDIKSLSYFFLNMFNNKYNKNITGFSNTLLDKIIKYNWPGNIRELKNSIEKSVIFCEKNLIQENDFYFEHDLDQKRVKKTEGMKIDFNSLPENFKEAKKKVIKKFEKRFILYHLRKNNFKVTSTSKKIGLYRQELYRKMKMLRIKKGEIKFR